MCVDCGAAQFYPKVTCTTCGSSELGWEEASGKGTLHTYTVARRATHPAFEGAGPYVVAVVELAEGPRVTTNIVECDLEDIRVDMAVELIWDEPGEDGICLPLFRPASTRPRWPARNRNAQLRMNPLHGPPCRYRCALSRSLAEQAPGLLAMILANSSS